MEEPKETTVASKYVLTGRLFEKKSLSGIEKALTTLSEEQLTMPLSSNSILEGSWEPSGTNAANGEEFMTGHQAKRFTGELPKYNHDMSEDENISSEVLMMEARTYWHFPMKPCR